MAVIIIIYAGNDVATEAFSMTRIRPRARENRKFASAFGALEPVHENFHTCNRAKQRGERGNSELVVARSGRSYRKNEKKKNSYSPDDNAPNPIANQFEITRRCEISAE